MLLIHAIARAADSQPGAHVASTSPLYTPGGASRGARVRAIVMLGNAGLLCFLLRAAGASPHVDSRAVHLVRCAARSAWRRSMTVYVLCAAVLCVALWP